MSDELDSALAALEAAIKVHLQPQPLRDAAPMMLAVLKQIMSHRHGQADWCPRCRKCAEDAAAAIRAAEGETS